MKKIIFYPLYALKQKMFAALGKKSYIIVEERKNLLDSMISICFSAINYFYL
jgi:hypothetical protein